MPIGIRSRGCIPCCLQRRGFLSTIVRRKGDNTVAESEFLHTSHSVSNLVYYFAATVRWNTNEDVIAQYVREQGKPDYEEYRQLSIFGKWSPARSASDTLLAKRGKDPVDPWVLAPGWFIYSGGFFL